jgi:hypothetical protein
MVFVNVMPVFSSGSNVNKVAGFLLPQESNSESAEQ